MRNLSILVLTSAFAFLVGCHDPTREIIARDRFIATYVDLRVAALRSDSGEIPDTAKQRVLEAHGVTDEDLLRFVEIRSAELQFMRDLWNEVELRLDSIPPEPPGQPDLSDSSDASD